MSRAAACRSTAWFTLRQGPIDTRRLFFFMVFPATKRIWISQAVRRAGWTVVTVNYRGSWGSPGNFRFAQNLEDAEATLAFIRSPENAKRLSIDVSRIVICASPWRMSSWRMERIGHLGLWRRSSFTENSSFFTATTSSRLIPRNLSKTSRQPVGRPSPRNMS